MQDTGLLQSALIPAARRIVFGAKTGIEIERELLAITEVDRAHVVMLSERHLLAPDAARALIRAIGRLRDASFAPLKERPAFRGLFLLYEDYLIETESAAVGGVLQTARSRNDLQATTFKLRLREPVSSLLRECLRLQCVLLRRALRYAGDVMPVYTHGQAALPSSYGHYLAAIAGALSRDMEFMIYACEDIHQCPLGAGAAGGSTLPIDTGRTARLLGFVSGPLNSIDAVASRDLVLRLLAGAAVTGVTLSRLAADLLQWCTAEFNFLRLPDEVVGSSSAMPQKRNPFLLEHVQGRGATALGAFVSAAAAMHSTPFSNSVAVGGESIRPIWKALADIQDCVTLARVVVSRAEPNRTAMLERARNGFVTATELANRIMRENNLDFRSSHRLVGSVVRSAAARGTVASPESSQVDLRKHGIAVSSACLDPESVASAAEFGGGPAPSSILRSVHEARMKLTKAAQTVNAWRSVWAEARTDLEARCGELCAEPVTPAGAAG
jgi:argininosuccinate lyase